MRVPAKRDRMRRSHAEFCTYMCWCRSLIYRALLTSEPPRIARRFRLPRLSPKTNITINKQSNCNLSVCARIQPGPVPTGALRVEYLSRPARPQSGMAIPAACKHANGEPVPRRSPWRDVFIILYVVCFCAWLEWATKPHRDHP